MQRYNFSPFHTKNGDFDNSPRRGVTINNVEKVESRAELVQAMPRPSKVIEHKEMLIWHKET